MTALKTTIEEIWAASRENTGEWDEARTMRDALSVAERTLEDDWDANSTEMDAVQTEHYGTQTESDELREAACN